MRTRKLFWSLGVAAVAFPVAILCIKESAQPKHPLGFEPAPAAATPLSPPLSSEAPAAAPAPSEPRVTPKAPSVSGVQIQYTPDGKIVQERKALFRHADGRVEEKTVKITATPVQKKIQVAPRKQPQK